MDARRLGLLRELDRLGTVTAVAVAGHLTPTAVSQQLKVLEREAGAALLRRVGRRVELTDAGRLLSAASMEQEVATARVQAAWDAYLGEVRGCVRLSVFPTAAQGILPGLLTRLAAHPELELEIVEADLHGDEYAARTDSSDIVLGHRASVEGGWSHSAYGRRGIRVLELVSEPLDVAVWPGHRLEQAGVVSAAELAEERWVGVPEEWPFDQALLAWFAASGLTPQVGPRFADLRTQEALVAAGHGVALMPRYATDDRAGSRLVLLRTRGLRQHRDIVALARADRAERAVVRVVLAELEAECASFTHR